MYIAFTRLISFPINSHPSQEITRVRHDESTSNLNRHVQHCSPANSAESRAMMVYAHSSSYNPAKHRLKIALWVARRNRPFAIVEDTELLEIFHDLNAACETPGRRTVARNIQEVLLVSRKRLGKILQVF